MYNVMYNVMNDIVTMIVPVFKSNKLNIIILKSFVDSKAAEWCSQDVGPV